MTPQTADVEPQYDEDGFLRNPAQWNRSVAEAIAQSRGISELTNDHWLVIQTLRDFYFENGSPPGARYACEVNHLQAHCMSTLFGEHPLEAWRVAGLPNPGEEAKAYW